MKLVKAKHSDLHDILCLHDKLFSYKYTYDNYLVELELEISDFMILKNNDEIVGYFITHSIYEKMELVIIAIDSAYQRQGYAQFLLDFIEYLKLRNGCEEIILEVEETNKGAIFFYEKNNFLKIDRRADYYAKGNHALIYIK